MISKRRVTPTLSRTKVPGDVNRAKGRVATAAGGPGGGVINARGRHEFATLTGADGEPLFWNAVELRERPDRISIATQCWCAVWLRSLPETDGTTPRVDSE